MRLFKHFLLFAVLLGLSFNSLNLYGQTGKILDVQHPYYDAVELFKILKDNTLIKTNSNGEKEVNNEDVAKVIVILEKYLPESERNNTGIDILKGNFDEANKFIRDYLDIISNKISKPEKKCVNAQEQLDYSLGKQVNAQKESIKTSETETFKGGGIGSFSVGTLAEGMAKFLVERAKSELSIAFFQKFKNALKNEKYLNTIFPTTTSTLKAIDPEIYNFSAYLQVLREAFEKDLKDLLANLPKILDIEAVNVFFNSKPEYSWIRSLLKAGFEITKGLADKKHPGEILADLNPDTFAGDKLSNLKNTVKLLKVISNSLKANNQSYYWITMNSFRKLFEGYTDGNNNLKKSYYAFEIYLGLLYQQTNDISFKIKIKNETDGKEVEEIVDKNFATDVLAASYVKFDEIKELIEKFIFKVNLLESFLDQIERIKERKEKPELEDYYKVFDGILDTLEYSKELFNYALKIINPYNKEGLNKKIAEYLKIARKIGDIYWSIKQKQYGQVVVNLMDITETIFTLSENEKIKEDSKYMDIKFKFLKYGSFIAAVAKAENADDVKKAIEAAALPVGSYRIKRNQGFSISLNSYVGLFGNSYYYNKQDTRVKNRVNLAISAPIGVAINGIIRCHGQETFIPSFFISIIDLGAIVRLQFEKGADSEGDTTGLSELTWKDILAPGAFILINIKKLPITFGIGVQNSPQLIKVNDDGSMDRTNRRWRWGLMVGVDIPLLHFK